MNHELKYNKFHYFEKQQLEDYINEMAKNGKYWECNIKCVNR